MTRQTWLERNWKLAGAAILVLVLFVAPIVWQFWIAPTVVEQNVKSGQEIAEQSLDSDEAIRNYRWFRTQWHEIQAQHAQTQNYKEELQRFYDIHGKDPDEWSRTAETRHGRIQERITGSQNQEEMLIAEYNARTEDATRAIFQCGLPNRVDKKLFITDGAGVSYTSQEAANMTAPEDPSQCKYAGNPDNQSD